MMSARVAALVLATSFIATTATAGPLAVTIDCGPTTAVPGGSAIVQINLAGEGDPRVAGMQNDLVYDDDLFSIEPADCIINPAIGPGTSADKRLSTALPPELPETLRNILVALDNSNTIPFGNLYTCTFDVAPNTPLGTYQFINTRITAADPEGQQLPVDGTDCSIEVVEPTPTPTPIGHCEDDDDCPPGQVCVNNMCVTPTPTATPLGFCNGNEDCPPGQVCVNNMCVTPTPTRTPIGFCERNEDCPPGQVCVDNQCVTPTPTPRCRQNSDCPSGEACINGNCVPNTPTATPTTRRKGGGDGCNCEIDPDAPAAQSYSVLAVLLPALVLALRWRSRRPAR